jgi:hypothetical protein
MICIVFFTRSIFRLLDEKYCVSNAYLQIPPSDGRGLHVLHSPLDCGFYLLWLESDLRCVIGALVAPLYGGLFLLGDRGFNQGKANLRFA